MGSDTRGCDNLATVYAPLLFGLVITRPEMFESLHPKHSERLSTAGKSFYTVVKKKKEKKKALLPPLFALVKQHH